MAHKEVSAAYKSHISRNHAEIQFDAPDRITVTDVSSNGTRLNGQRLEHGQPVELSLGRNEIDLGAGVTLVIARTLSQEEGLDSEAVAGDGVEKLIAAWQLRAADDPLKESYGRVLTDRMTRGGRSWAAFPNENRGVRFVVFSPDGTQLAMASDDKSSRIWHVATGRTLTICGIITGAFPLTKPGLGAAVLSGGNIHTGDTTLAANSGPLEIGGAGKLGNGSYAGAIEIGIDSIFKYNSSAAQTLNGAIGGAGSLVKSAGSTLTLGAANTSFTGSVAINAGTLSLTNASASVVTVNYATANDTAVTPNDYVAVSSTTLTFNPGAALTQTLTVVVNGDTIDAGASAQFFVDLSGAGNATIGDNQGIGTITDDDNAPVIAINDVTVTEGDSGTVNATFTVSVNSTATSNITVNYATANDTATAPADFDAVSTTTLTFVTGGPLSQTVTVVVNGVALSAILFRVSEWGITPNRLAVFGGNVLFLINLFLVTSQLFRVLSKKADITRVWKAIASYLPVYFVWTIIVAFIFPLVFGFK